MRVRLLLLLFAMFVSGCANLYSEQHFESRPHMLAEPVQRADEARLYLLRDKNAIEAFSYVPLAPQYLALNGTMLAIMPVGSYVSLSVKAGVHRIARMGLVSDLIAGKFVLKDEIAISVVAGRTYYVASRMGLGSQPFTEVPTDEGVAIMKKTSLAKTIASPATQGKFLETLATQGFTLRQPAEKTNRPPGPTLGERMGSAMPTSAQVGDALATVATVALIALLIFGAAAGAGASDTPPTVPLIYRPTVTIAAPVSNAKTVQTIRDMNSGTTYRIEGKKFSGTDGSSGQISGNLLTTSDGEMGRIVGNHIFFSGGRSCTLYGALMDCTPAKR